MRYDPESGQGAAVVSTDDQRTFFSETNWLRWGSRVLDASASQYDESGLEKTEMRSAFRTSDMRIH
jgi:hypothetical protein